MNVEKLLDCLDGSGSTAEYEAVCSLRKSGKFPALLREKYHRETKLGPRTSCVFHCIPFAHRDPIAVDLGLEALKDRSKRVRYRACMLLACSLERRALLLLGEVAETSRCTETRAHATAAMDAIENQCADYFVDREHSGMMTLSFSRL